MSKRCLLTLASLLVLVFALPGCGGGSSNTPPPPPKSEFLYAVSFDLLAGSTSISSFTLTTATGALQPTSTTTSNALIAGVAVTPSAKFLYASAPNLVTANFIDIFSISATSGAPSPAGAFSPDTICAICPPHSGPGALAVAPGGKTLYYGSSTGGPVVQGVGALALSPIDGSLSTIAGSPFPANDMPIGVLVHPAGKFLYTVNVVILGSPLVTSISCFSIDAGTGALVPIPGSPFPVAGNNEYANFGIDPNGKFLFVPTGTSAAGILGWSIDSTTGALTPLLNSPFVPGSVTVGATFDKAGKFVYASGGRGGGVLGFSIDSTTGNLTPLTGSPFFAGSTLLNQVVDPSGAWLFAVDATQKAVVAFGLDETTGSLSFAASPPPTPVPTPANLIIRSAP